MTRTPPVYTYDADDPSYRADTAVTEVDDLLARVEAWVAGDVDPDDQAELRTLLEQARRTDVRSQDARAAVLDELRDRFAGDLAFGTAGLRGRMAAGPHRMNRAVVTRAAAGLGAFLHDEVGPGARVVVGYDARHRSERFALDTAEVLTAAGAQVLLMPKAWPTPVLAFAVRHLDADAGVMVTASHNPPADNGYKVYLGGRVVTDAGQGAQIVPPFDASIAAAIDAAPPAADVARAPSGWTVLDRSVARAYLDTLGRWADDGPRRLRIVTTALHGVGGAMLSRALGEAGFRDVVPVEEQFAPDPTFGSVAFPNPEEPGAIDMALALAQDAGADLVIANDPDADRCAVAVLDPSVGTHQGAETARSNGWRMLHGDEVGALLGEEVAASAPPGSVLASSIVSSRLLARVAAAHGLEHRTTLTGFKWISRVDGLVYGYEEALGYCVDPATVRDKDGISAAVVVARLAARLHAEGRTLLDALDDLARTHGLHLTDQVSARFSDLSEIPATMERLRARPPRVLGGIGVRDVVDLSRGQGGLPPTDGVLLRADDDTRVIVRPSGTEPKVKCYLEVVVPVDADASHDAVVGARVRARAHLDAVAADVRRALGL
ncbi:phosphomannomutase [Sediminihabitans luteus]|uniref:Phosphomannomutase n=1 Tax=Sediminihabitans luteus TaxID=1138585 RepID=A0A2M9CYF3_9CELL|nr:phospho-sugar mutase [Sediminihabitans luteus]PJJ76966.1 phosphomannomutase [Sediminihabitans luteus]GII99607.1 phosphomannomutase [Sediminihabitans luteus]